MNMGIDDIKYRLEEIFEASVDTIVFNGETFIIMGGTGDGTFAYSQCDAQRGLEAAEEALADDMDPYDAFCNATTQEVGFDLARAVRDQLDRLICDYSCRPILTPRLDEDE